MPATTGISSSSVLIFISGDGFSAIEFRTVFNSLIKNKYAVFVTSTDRNVCTGDDLTKVRPDVLLSNVRVSNFAALVLIGGKGIIHDFDNVLLHKISRDFSSNQKIIAAICAAPVILVRSGVLSTGKAVCHPAYKEELIKSQIDYSDKNVHLQGNLITGKDASVSAEFTAALLEKLKK